VLPESFAELIVKEACPVDLAVMDWVAVDFTATSPNAMEEELRLMDFELDELVEATPVPDRMTVALGFESALVANATAPDASPDADGSNATVQVADWPGANAAGKAGPLSEKLELPESFAELTVREACPVDLTTMDRVTLEFNVRLPNAMDDVLRVIVLEVAMPVPDSATVAVGLESALVANATVAEAAPDAVGSNATCQVADWPGASVAGRAGPLSLKLVLPDSFAELIVNAASPVDLAVIDRVAVEFTARSPNEIAEELRLKDFELEGFEDATPEPVKATVASRSVPEELAANVRVPVAVPAAEGVKSTFQTTVSLGGSVAGSGGPCKTKLVLPDSLA